MNQCTKLFIVQEDAQVFEDKQQRKWSGDKSGWGLKTEVSSLFHFQNNNNLIIIPLLNVGIGLKAVFISKLYISIITK